ncbi:hypothetical protein HRbin06_01004 [archaeon HR06]|nr:hypothetical protein HRbin06_01004 [archaeon HR06]
MKLDNILIILVSTIHFLILLRLYSLLPFPLSLIIFFSLIPYTFLFKREKREENEELPLTFETIGFKILKAPATKLVPFRDLIRKNLLRAGVSKSHYIYLANMVFWSIISFPISFFIIKILYDLFFVSLLGYPPNLTYPIIGAIITSFGVYGISFLYPYYLAGKLKRNIDKNLVYITNFMSILASAGATTEEIFLSLARVGDIYGIKPIARSIVKSLQFLGKDIFTTLDEESKRSPSRYFSELIQGFLASVKAGGKPEDYLLTMSDKYIELRRRMLTRIIHQLNMAAEIYVAGLVALPIIFTTMMSIMGLLGGEVIAGLSADILLSLMSYIFLPLTATAVIIYIDMVVSGA